MVANAEPTTEYPVKASSDYQTKHIQALRTEGNGKMSLLENPYFRYKLYVFRIFWHVITVF